MQIVDDQLRRAWSYCASDEAVLVIGVDQMILIPPRQLGLAQGNQAAVKAAGIGTPGSQQCRRGQHDRPHHKLGRDICRCTFWHPFGNVRALSGY
jgi:hypothetical protein